VILILTMAGKYQRFVDEGYKTPKYLLPWGGRVILWTILQELRQAGNFTEIFLVANSRDESFMPHVRAIMESMEIPVQNLVLIGDTRGQAETASIGLEAIGKSNLASGVPIAFHNVDTILYRRNFQFLEDLLSKSDGYIDVFGSSNKNYSFVLADNNNQVMEIAEKIVISDMATSGFYAFANANTYQKSYVKGEDIYISSIYKKIIARDGKVIVGEKCKEADTVVLGTPSEYFNASLLQWT
jgi:dTDP-glucose pyrophosphorylase